MSAAGTWGSQSGVVQLHRCSPTGCLLAGNIFLISISAAATTYWCLKRTRFIYLHTPKLGSWLNLIETVFGKMARTFLKAIRVKSREELKQRILQGVREMNLAPVVVRWKKFALGLA